MEVSNSFPGVDSVPLYSNNTNTANPTLTSPSSEYDLQFYQTRDSLMDVESYRGFLQNAIKRFRKSVTYKHYKGFLIDLGMDHCQVHGNLSSEMVTIEMHHMILTIFDIALIITEHILNTVGYISTFDLVTILKEEHKNNNVPLVMLSLTPHQLYHNEPMFYIDPSMCIGRWDVLLEKYKCGITQDIAFKLLAYFKYAAEQNGKTEDNDYLKLRDEILDWSDKHDRQ